MPDLRSHAVAELAGELVVDITRELNDLVRLCPDIRLVLVHPIYLGGAADVAERLVHSREAEFGTVGEGDRLFDARTFALVQPHDERTQDIPVFVHESDGVADGGDADGDYAVKSEGIVLFEDGDGFDETVPIDLGVLLRPAAA